MELGRIVLSKCGRDKDKYFIVIAVDEQGDHVFITDGDIRKLESPKKKKIKHLLPVAIDKELQDKLLNNIKLTNSDIKKYLKKFIVDLNSNENFESSIPTSEGEGCNG